MTNPIVLIAFGIFVGVFSGLMGVGGGAVMVPVMVLAMGLSQVKAHGLSLLVMVPLATLPAVLGYFREGKLQTEDIWTAGYIWMGFMLGGFFGSQLAVMIDKHKGMLAMVFGLLLVYVAMYTALGKGNLARSVLLSLVVTGVAAAAVLGTKWYDARQKNDEALASNQGTDPAGTDIGNTLSDAADRTNAHQ